MPKTPPSTTCVVLDLETTWLSPKEDSIIEIALVRINMNDFSEIERYSTCVNPEKPIPEMISQITNIFESDVADAPVFDDIMDEVQSFLWYDPIVGHNISFDVRFLESHGIDTRNNPKIDTFFFANFLLSDSKSLNLGYIAEYFGIPLENAHRALDDTLATVQVFQKLIEQLTSQPLETRQIIATLFSQARDPAIHLISDLYLSGVTPYTPEELSRVYIEHLKKNIVDIQDISEAKDMPDMKEFLQNIEDFELRESQIQMLDTVDRTITEWKKTIIEAPTGIGKTFAYTLPALKYSLEFWEPVHISTSTKALQDQIFYKDLAFLSNIFPHSFSYTKLKGKRNYLGISPFFEFLETRDTLLSNEELGFILKVLLWSMTTEYGELDELDYYGEEYSFLGQIHAGESFIFDESNRYKELEFALRARNRAKNANIIITNNHILFQDVLSEGSLLWGVKNLIIDEAHALEDVVTQAMKRQISFQYFQNILESLEKKMKKSWIPLETLWVEKQSLLFQAGDVFSLIEGSIFERFSLDTRYKTFLLDEAYFQDRDELILAAAQLQKHLKSFLQLFVDFDEKQKKSIQREYQDLVYFSEILTDIFDTRDFEKHVYYVVHDDTRGTQVFTTLLRPGAFLQEYLWSKLESVVLTSATLQMDDDFAYISSILDLSDFEKYELPSDFDYAKQALVFIPQDLGSIKNNLEQIITFLESFFETVWGRTLVLFTAFSVIREVYTRLKISLEQQNIHLLAQSISGSKQKQIEFFKKQSDHSILLGTDTFWEGIDIPGEDLTYLVVHKIPFAVPTDPIFQARSRLFANSFEDYAIPKSVLKLKQGFWRLIRSQKDTWIIIFLDDRIYSTSWGEKFYHAFPKDIKIRYGETSSLLSLLTWK